MKTTTTEIDRLAARAKQAAAGRLTAAECRTLGNATAAAIEAARAELHAHDAARATALAEFESGDALATADSKIATAEAQLARLDPIYRAFEAAIAQAELAEAPTVAKKALKQIPEKLAEFERAASAAEVARAALRVLTDDLRVARETSRRVGAVLPGLPAPLFERVAAALWSDAVARRYAFDALIDAATADADEPAAA